MNHSPTAPAPGRRARPTVLAALAVASAALLVLLAYGSLTPSDASLPGVVGMGADSFDSPHDDGRVGDDVTVFDEGMTAIAKLDPDLRTALRDAATDAADDDTTLYVNSGWRSADYQRQLLRDAVSTYGSESEAARWVATPETSPHVSGDAVDIGPVDAMSWLSQHGAAYGLCQVYGNEPWHFELRSAASDHGCPAMYADPTQDPRMQR